MQSYKKIYDFRDLRKPHSMPNYPPYSSELLEEYFYDYYIKNMNKIPKHRIYIPGFWTNILCEQQPIHYRVPEYLDALDRNTQYFTVVQHDEDFVYPIPKWMDLKIFSAGGRTEKCIPIPLVGSSIPEKYLEKREKDIFCSGIYSQTHEVRNVLHGTFKDDPEFVLNPRRSWSDSVPEQDFVNFCEITKRSYFALAPRGYGLNSFRLYEILQLRAIPVIVTDKFYLPFFDIEKWKSFAVLCHASEIHSLKEKLKSYSSEKRLDMIEKGARVYKEFFTLEKVCENIIKMI